MVDWGSQEDLPIVTEVNEGLDESLLSTGSSMLNLACSGRINGGFLSGKYYLLVGDAAAGKTMLSLTCLAEATISEEYSDYRLIYDNIEDGCAIDLARFFSEEFAERLEAPQSDSDGNPIYSSTVEEFYYHLDDLAAANVPFIYVLDSMDALRTEADDAKFEEHKKAAQKGTSAAGSYAMTKAKLNSEMLRRALPGLRRNGSILIIIAQTRANVGFGFDPKTRSGGHALRFYAFNEIWLSLGAKIKRAIRGKPRKIGDSIKAKVKKNRTTGRLHEVSFDIYPAFGIDDTGSIVDFLVAEGGWSKSRSQIIAPSLQVTKPRESLIHFIEKSDERLGSVKVEAEEVWRTLEEEKAKCVTRRNRFVQEEGG